MEARLGRRRWPEDPGPLFTMGEDLCVLGRRTPRCWGRGSRRQPIIRSNTVFGGGRHTDDDDDDDDDDDTAHLCLWEAFPGHSSPTSRA